MILTIERISKQTVLEIHRLKIKQYGGGNDVREEGLLEAAIAQPWESVDGVELYPSTEEKAARIGYEIITQHPFDEGNKRVGAALVGILLRANGITFKPQADDYLKTTMGVEDGSLGYDDLLEFIKRSK